VKTLSLDRFCINRTNYETLPFLASLVELKVRADRSDEDCSKTVNQCKNLKQLLLRYCPQVLNRIKLQSPLANLFLCSSSYGLLSEVLDCLAKVPSRRTYLFFRDSLVIDLEIEGLQTAIGEKPEGKTYADLKCSAVYYEYNTIDEVDLAEFGPCYKLGFKCHFLMNKERNFLLKLKSQSSEASIIIEAAYPIMPMSEKSWRTFQKFKDARSLKLIQAKSVFKNGATSRGLLQEGRH